MPTYTYGEPLSPEQQKEADGEMAWLKERYACLHDPDYKDNPGETLQEAVAKLRLKRMSELIGQMAAEKTGDPEEGKKAAARFYALGLAHLEGPQAFREKFAQEFPPKPA